MKIYIIGGSGAGRSLLELANRERICIDGIFDSRIPTGKKVGTTYCIGKLSEAYFYNHHGARFLTCIGSVDSIKRRKSIIDSFKISKMKFISYVSKTSIIEVPETHVGSGSIIFDHVFVGYEARIDEFVILNTQSYIGHETSIGAFSIIGPSACIAGNSTIGSFVYVGANSTIRDHINVGDNIIIGAGANVTKSLMEPGIYIGNPARIMHKKL